MEIVLHFYSKTIPVPKGRDSFGQHQEESRPMARPDFLIFRKVFVSYLTRNSKALPIAYSIISQSDFQI